MLDAFRLLLLRATYYCRFRHARHYAATPLFFDAAAASFAAAC